MRKVFDSFSGVKTKGFAQQMCSRGPSRLHVRTIGSNQPVSRAIVRMSQSRDICQFRRARSDCTHAQFSRHATPGHVIAPFTGSSRSTCASRRQMCSRGVVICDAVTSQGDMNTSPSFTPTAHRLKLSDVTLTTNQQARCGRCPCHCAIQRDVLIQYEEEFGQAFSY